MKLKMKTTATLLIAIFMISTFAVAVPLGAYTGDDYTVAVLEAADRLVQMQNPDGGFTWRVEPLATTGPGTSGTNTLGITAMGILKAHELLDKAEYETALAKAYGYATENTAWYAYPDITFLIWLADAFSADASLEAAIVAEVSGTTDASIRALALSIWNTRRFGGPKDDQTLSGSATDMAEYDFTRRGSGTAFWDTGAAVKAALALGFDSDANDIADVMYAHLQAKDPVDIEDTADPRYALALSGAIEGFSELGVYPTIARTMTDLLIANQYGVGIWDQGGGVDSDIESVQTTAYAIMALIAQGDEDAVVAASKGADWLVDIQTETGGWYPGYVGATLENLEVDAEAAWALCCMMASQSVMLNANPDGYDLTVDVVGKGTVDPPGKEDCFSGEVVSLDALPAVNWQFTGWTGTITSTDDPLSVTMYEHESLIAHFDLNIVSISVSPTTVDFGTVIIGTVSPEKPITITNEGNVRVEIDASVIEEPAFYETYLRIGVFTVSDWSAREYITEEIDVGGTLPLDLTLDLTACRVVGPHEGILVFWAEEA